MKSENRDLLYVNHVIESIEKIELYISSCDYSEFCSNAMLYDAVIRNLQILAESTQKISYEIKMAYPEVSWKDIAGFRNILVHDYLDGIDEDAVWNIVIYHLPKLKDLFKTIYYKITMS